MDADHDTKIQECERLGKLYEQLSALVKEHGLVDVESLLRTLAEDERG